VIFNSDRGIVGILKDIGYLIKWNILWFCWKKTRDLTILRILSLRFSSFLIKFEIMPDFNCLCCFLFVWFTNWIRFLCSLFSHNRLFIWRENINFNKIIISIAISSRNTTFCYEITIHMIIITYALPKFIQFLDFKICFRMQLWNLIKSNTCDNPFLIWKQ